MDLIIGWIAGSVPMFLIAALVAWLAPKAGWLGLEEYQICGAAFLVLLVVAISSGGFIPERALAIYGPAALLVYLIRTRRNPLGRRIALFDAARVGALARNKGIEKTSGLVIAGRSLASGLAVLLALQSINDFSAPIMAGLGLINVNAHYVGGAVLGGLLFGSLAVALTRRRQYGLREPIALTPDVVTQFYAWCEREPQKTILVGLGGFLAAFGAVAIFSSDYGHALAIALAIGLGGLFRQRQKMGGLGRRIV